MALIDSLIFKYIVPESETDSNAESWEYFLVWISPSGAVNHWIFTDFEEKQAISGTVINTKTENINKLFSEAKNTISLTAEDINSNEFDAISTILRAKEIRRYYKDNSFEKLAIVTNSKRKLNSGYRYNFDIEVRKLDSKLLK